VLSCQRQSRLCRTRLLTAVEVDHGTCSLNRAYSRTLNLERGVYVITTGSGDYRSLMEHQASVLCSQDSIAGPYPVRTLILSSLKIRLNIRLTFLLQLDFSSSIFTSTASVVYWSEFLATDPEDSGSIPVATRFSEM
jgi:hypothetical protein